MLPTKPAGPDIGKSRPQGGLASVVPVVPSARHDAPGRAFRYPTAEPEHHPAWKQARAEIPAARADPLILEFRRTVRAGLASVPRIPGPEHSTAQHPGRDLLEFCRECEDDAPRFCRETSVWPTNNISERGGRHIRPSRRYPAASPATTPPRTGWTFAATSTPAASTVTTLSPSCAAS